MSATPATLPGSAELAKAAASAAIPLLKIDPARFRADFGDRPFRIRHRLASHELFALPRETLREQTAEKYSDDGHDNEMP